MKSQFLSCVSNRFDRFLFVSFLFVDQLKLLSLQSMKTLPFFKMLTFSDPKL